MRKRLLAKAGMIAALALSLGACFGGGAVPSELLTLTPNDPPAAGAARSAGEGEGLAVLTRSLGERGPEIAATRAEARNTMRQAGQAIERFGQLANTTDAMLQREGASTFSELRQTLTAAQRSLGTLETAIGELRPGLQTFSDRTLPDVSALLRDLRATSESLRRVTERLEQQGVGGIIGSERLPDYQPR